MEQKENEEAHAWERGDFCLEVRSVPHFPSHLHAHQTHASHQWGQGRHAARFSTEGLAKPGPVCACAVSALFPSRKMPFFSSRQSDLKGSWHFLSMTHVPLSGEPPSKGSRGWRDFTLVAKVFISGSHLLWQHSFCDLHRWAQDSGGSEHRRETDLLES